eukprot:1745344-Amphidinium_carterae.1
MVVACQRQEAVKVGSEPKQTISKLPSPLSTGRFGRSDKVCSFTCPLQTRDVGSSGCHRSPLPHSLLALHTLPYEMKIVSSYSLQLLGVVTSGKTSRLYGHSCRCESSVERIAHDTSLKEGSPTD